MSFVLADNRTERIQVLKRLVGRMEVEDAFMVGYAHQRREFNDGGVELGAVLMETLKRPRL